MSDTSDHDTNVSALDASMVDTFEEAMRAEHSPQNSGDAFGLTTGCLLSFGGSAAAGSEASDVLGQAAPVLNAASRVGVGRPVTGVV